MTYFLIKITPPWGLVLLFTTFAYFIPLIYIQNRELIDSHVSNAQDILSKQATQVRDLAAEHTNKAVSASSSALKDYSGKAQEMIGTAKKTAVDKGYVSAETAGTTGTTTGTTGTGINTTDFPNAPTAAPASHDGAYDSSVKVTDEEKEPLLA